jgi:DNA sulfur modification protein DndD
MRLTQLELNNFRPYYGRVTLDFPDVRAGELFLVHGKNGFGKTSMFSAVQWALYGEGTRRELYDHANNRAKGEAEFEMSVSLAFTHDDREYRLTRTAKANRDAVEAPEHLTRSSLTLYRDGAPLPGGEHEVAQERIETIIPRDASQFFFFDGEKIGKYSSSEHTDDTRSAIELVLGLRAVQNARTDASNLKSQVRRTRNAAMKKNEEQANLISKQELLEQEIEGLQRAFVEAEKALDELDTKRQGYRSQLEELSEVQELARERQRLEQDAASVKEERDAVIETLKKESRGLYLRVLAPLVIQAHDQCAAEYEALRERETTRRLDEAVSTFLEKLASEEVCVCGQPLGEHERSTILSHARSQVVEVVAEMTSAETVTEVASRLELLRRARLTAERAAQRFEEFAVKKIDMDEKLSGLESRVASLTSQMNSVDADSVNSLRDLLERAESEYQLTQKERLALDVQIEHKKSEADSLDKQIRKLGGATGTAAALEAQIDLLEKTERAFDAFLLRAAKARRTQIEEQANHFFKQITNKATGYDSMFIADDFTFGINAADGTRPNMDQISEGEKQVVAFSFIMGLNRYTRSSAPLIIDTPMGRLDEEHRPNLASAIAALEQQVFLFVTETDLAFGVEPILREAVEKDFAIVHDQSTLSSTIKEVSR